MYKIVASDLDGTLLNSKSQLSVSTKNVLKTLTEKGVHFIFATGRHHLDVANIKDTVGIDAYMITSNGARIHNPQGQLISAQNLEEDIVADLISIANTHPEIITHVYRDDDWFSDKHVDDLERFFPDSTDFSYQLFTPDDFDLSSVAKIYFTTSTVGALEPFEKEIKKRWGDRVNVCFSTMDCLEVMDGQVSKGNALAYVVAQLGYDLQDCIAFGDGMNDVEMLTCVGKGCVMQNAPDRLKSTAPHLEVIGYNNDDAVATYLQQIYTKS